MTFEELQLAPLITKALARCGHHNPTAVQEMAIPKVLAGHDLIVSAQTGTGKTAAFVLPALQRLFSLSADRKPGLRVLVITPTRELADQITQVARDYGKYFRVHSVAIVGGMPFGNQIRALSQNPDIIVGTPGRLIDHVWRGRIDLSQVELLVFDEADRMLDMGFVSDVEFITEAVPEGCQTLLFAATMGDATARLAHKYMKNPERVEVARGKITHDRIEQQLLHADNVLHKHRLLKELCQDKTMTRAVVFSATKRAVDSLARTLSMQGHQVSTLHADMTQDARNRAIMDMRKGKIRILVATDVAARGLDISGVSHVINFDLPRSAEDYVNRIGRTGRAGASGIAISFVSKADLPYLDRIERYLGYDIPGHVIPGIERDHPARPQSGRERDNRQAIVSTTGSPAKRSQPDRLPRRENGAGDDRKLRMTDAPLTLPGTSKPERRKSAHAGPNRRRNAEENDCAEGGTGSTRNLFGLPRNANHHRKPGRA